MIKTSIFVRPVCYRQSEKQGIYELTPSLGRPYKHIKNIYVIHKICVIISRILIKGLKKLMYIRKR